jgi:hypothetical protein
MLDGYLNNIIFRISTINHDEIRKQTNNSFVHIDDLLAYRLLLLYRNGGENRWSLNLPADAPR